MPIKLDFFIDTINLENVSDLLSFEKIFQGSSLSMYAKPKLKCALICVPENAATKKGFLPEKKSGVCFGGDQICMIYAAAPPSRAETLPAREE